jgi:hypothetical protein
VRWRGTPPCQIIILPFFETPLGNSKHLNKTPHAFISTDSMTTPRSQDAPVKRIRKVYRKTRSIYLEKVSELGIEFTKHHTSQEEKDDEDEEVEDTNEKGDDSGTEKTDEPATELDTSARTRKGWKTRRLAEKRKIEHFADPVFECMFTLPRLWVIISNIDVYCSRKCTRSTF